MLVPMHNGNLGGYIVTYKDRWQCTPVVALLGIVAVFARVCSIRVF